MLRFRTLVVLAALAGAAGFVLLDKPASPPEAAAVNPERAAAARTAPAETLQVPERGGLERARGQLFGVPPAPQPQPSAAGATAPPVPVAPPVPYRFAGKLRTGSEEEVLISKGELVFPVKVGDLLDGMYKVESISAERIELLYLPLGTRDRIVVSSTLDAERAAAPIAAAPSQSSPAPVADGGPAQLRWEGPERVQAGASFSVALRVNTKEVLRAAPMQLRFEPGVLEPVSVRPGKFFGQGNFAYRVNPEGSIFVGATSSTAAMGTDAELVVVTFRPIKRGTTAELSMSALSLQGAAGRAIAHEQPATFRTAIQ